MLSTSTPSSSSYIPHPPFLPLPNSPAFLSTGVQVTPPARLSVAVDRIGFRWPWWIKGRGRTVPRFVVSGGITEVDEGRFSEAVLGSDVPVLVELMATWCGPCRLLSPRHGVTRSGIQGRLKVAKIDHGANPKLIEEYKVYGLPTLILFEDGEEVPDSRREGAITKAKLELYLDPLLTSISVS